MEELEPIGLITDPKIKNFYIDKFKVSLTSDKKVQVYISKKHGNGAGEYEINSVNVNGQKVILSLDFKRDMFEAGAAVINQRVLFFKTQPHCKIVQIILKK
ncbi:hypothetical protein OAQ56_03295 [Alphaproteobacteria bacterium]|nr:hypothetical protein [Alphaproteobacteria bacterium]